MRLHYSFRQVGSNANGEFSVSLQTDRFDFSSTFDPKKLNNGNEFIYAICSSSVSTGRHHHAISFQVRLPVNDEFRAAAQQGCTALAEFALPQVTERLDEQYPDEQLVASVNLGACKREEQM